MNIVDLPSPNHAARPDGSVVDVLVLHYTELPLRESLDILRDATREIRVSSHYVLDLDGTAYRLVPEDRTAWHAGKSWWRGREALNASAWAQTEEDGEEAAEAVEEGSMPPRQYQLLHPDARLSDEERRRLVAALEALPEPGSDGPGGDGGDSSGPGGGGDGDGDRSGRGDGEDNSG